MTIQEQIKVMEHFAHGGEVEIELGEDKWIQDYDPKWSWVDCNYRIKQEPKKIVKLYKFAYRFTDQNIWNEGSYFYEYEEEAIEDMGLTKNNRVIRLDYTEIIVEEY